MSKIILPDQIEKSLYTAEGDKYDYKQDPWDVTGLLQADPKLAQQMLELGYAAYWEINKRWRLTERGFKEMERRKALASMARKQGDVRAFEDDGQLRKHEMAKAELTPPPLTAEEKALRDPKQRGPEYWNKEHDNA